MTITGITGEIGSGKSFVQLRYALSECNSKHKDLVCNFPVNLKALKLYGRASSQPYLIYMADNNKIHTISALDNLEALLHLPNSVVCLDEAGIFLNSREFAKTPKSLLANLAQSRKDGIDLIYAAQFDEQVDRQFRMLTQYFVHADGLTQYSKVHRRPLLRWKYYTIFKANNYWKWVANPRDRSSAVRTWLSGFKTEFGPLTHSDRLLFNVFDSFSRLDWATDSNPSLHHKDYQDSIKDFQRSIALRREMSAFHRLQIHEKLCYPRSFLHYLKYWRKYSF